MPTPHHVIFSQKADSTAHFPSLEIEYADGLNVIMGTPGAGKSALLEQLLFALSAPPPKSARLCRLLAGTLGQGVVTVSVGSQHGARFTSARSHGKEACVRDERGKVAPVSLDGELFRVEMYRQAEISPIGDSLEAQLALIDNFADGEMRRSAEAIAQVLRRLTLDVAEGVRLGEEIAEQEEQVRELPSVEAALAALVAEPGPDAALASRAHDAKLGRTRERAATTALAGELGAVKRALDGFAADARRRLAGACDASLEQGANGALVAGIHARVRALAGAIETAAGDLRGEVGRVEASLADDTRTLGLLHVAADDEYARLALRFEEDRGRAQERERLQRRVVELGVIAKGLAARRADRDARDEARRGLLAELARLRTERFDLRLRIAGELDAGLGGAVTVEVTRAGDVRAYEALLVQLLQGKNIRPAEFIGEIARRVRPEALLAAVRANDTRVLTRLDEAKGERVERAQRILDALRDSGRLHELEVVELGDVPVIGLRVAGEYLPLAVLSPGQRCTALLPILLLGSVAPLIIDQPEDSLDNAFIYDVLVPSLIHVKKRRQIILISHNPNIPVLADAERVFQLAVDAKGGRLAAFGTVDEMREWIERQLEGGREAFLRRAERYGHIKREKTEPPTGGKP